MDDLVGFLRARLHEQELIWRDGLTIQTQPEFAQLSRVILNDIAAKRAIVDRCEFAVAWTSLAWAVMCDLATPFGDHPDYDNESWVPPSPRV